MPIHYFIMATARIKTWNVSCHTMQKLQQLLLYSLHLISFFVQDLYGLFNGGTRTFNAGAAINLLP